MRAELDSEALAPVLAVNSGDVLVEDEDEEIDGDDGVDDDKRAANRLFCKLKSKKPSVLRKLSRMLNKSVGYSTYVPIKTVLKGEWFEKH